jgi:ABC-type multidrug transport system ATPase subunit
MNRPSHPCILNLQDLRFAYPGQPPIVAGWSAAIGRGVTLLHGDTGSGKSTLLRVMAGLLPARGQLDLGGVRLDGDPEAYRRQIFFCDPGAEEYDGLAVRACTQSLHADDPDFDASRWQALVEGFALAPHLDKQMHMLSTGSRRKVALAAALASGRALTLLDEPTAGLDAASIRCLWRALADVTRQSGRVVVVATSERIDQVPLAASIDLPLR